MIDIEQTLKEMSQERPIFHSEKDFQFALAWKIKEQENCEVRLEQNVKINDTETISVDICVIENDKLVPIELKYKTKSFIGQINKEKFELKNQDARDQGCFDYLKDIQRIENCLISNNLEKGYAIILTNDRLYWENKTSNTNFEQFKVYDGRKITGSLCWKVGTSDSSKSGRDDCIKLLGNYNVLWKDYFKTTNQNQVFRYVLIEIQRQKLSKNNLK